MKNKYVTPMLRCIQIKTSLMFTSSVDFAGNGNGRPAEAKGGGGFFMDYYEEESDEDE